MTSSSDKRSKKRTRRQSPPSPKRTLSASSSSSSHHHRKNSNRQHHESSTSTFGNIDWGDLPAGHTDSVQKVMEDLQQLDQIRRGPAMNRSTSFPTEQERRRQQQQQQAKKRQLIPPSATPRSRSASFNLKTATPTQTESDTVTKDTAISPPEPLKRESSASSSSSHPPSSKNKGVLISTPPKQYRFGKSVRPAKSPSKQVSFQFPRKRTTTTTTDGQDQPLSPPEPTRSASLNNSFQPSANNSKNNAQSRALLDMDQQEEEADAVKNHHREGNGEEQGMETILLGTATQLVPKSQNNKQKHPFDEPQDGIEDASIAQITNRKSSSRDNSSSRWWMVPDFSASKVTTIVNEPSPNSGTKSRTTPVKDNRNKSSQSGADGSDRMSPRTLFGTPMTDVSAGEDTSAMKVLGCASEFDETTESSSSWGPCKGWTRGERRLRRILAIAAIVVLVFLGLAIFVFLESRDDNGSSSSSNTNAANNNQDDLVGGPTPPPTRVKKIPETPSPSSDNTSLPTPSPSAAVVDDSVPTASVTASPTPRPSTPSPTMLPTSIPTDMPVEPPSDLSTLERTKRLILSASPESEDALKDPGSPQSRALTWIVVEQEQGRRRQVLLRRSRRSLAGISSNSSILQRWVLATFFYSTNGDLWNRKDGWLSNGNECTWFSTQPSTVCNQDGFVQSIDLQNNNLGGTLPPELSILGSTLGKK